MLCAAASVRDEANCVPSACCYSGRYVCDTTDKLEATEVQWSFGLCLPSLPSPLRLAGARHISSLAMRCHCNLLDHMPCVMLIGLTRPKKVPATIKICLRGEVFEIVFSCKILSLFFPFYPQTFWPSCRYNKGKHFFIRYCRNKLHDSNKGKNGDLQICRYSNSCRYLRCC